MLKPLGRREQLGKSYLCVLMDGNSDAHTAAIGHGGTESTPEWLFFFDLILKFLYEHLVIRAITTALSVIRFVFGVFFLVFFRLGAGVMARKFTLVEVYRFEILQKHVLRIFLNHLHDKDMHNANTS